MSHLGRWILLTLALPLAGCRISSDAGAIPQSRTRNATVQPAAPRSLVPESSAGKSAGDRLAAGPLTLADALTLAERLSPDLAAAGAAADAANGRWLQSGLYPNPILTLSAEDGPARELGLRHGKLTVAVEQTLILGGRRTAAWNEGWAGARAAESERDSVQRRVRLAVTADFLAVLYAQRVLALNQELRHLAVQFNEVTQARVDLQAAPEIEALKTRIEAEQMSQELVDSESRLVIARRILAADLGDGTLLVGECSGSLGSPVREPDADLLRKALVENHPLLAAADRERERIEAGLARLRAERIPDLTLEVGLGRIEDERETILQTTLGIPLPAFNRNQGSLLEAEADRRRVRHLRASMLNSLLAQFEAAQSRYAAATARVRRCREHILPAAELAQARARDAYALGKSTILEAIDAQRTLIGTRTALLDAERELSEAAAELESLTGVSLLTPAPAGPR